MTIQEFRDYMASGKPVVGGGDVHMMFHQLSQEALKITAEINGKYHTPEQLHDLLEQLWGREVPKTVGMFPPFHTDCGKNTIVGERVFINMGCKFQDQGGITIDEGALIGHNVVLATINHDLDPAKRQSMSYAPIHIGKNVWIGANATVLAGVTIGERGAEYHCWRRSSQGNKKDRDKRQINRNLQMKEVSVLVGAGSIGQAIIRRVSAGKHVVLADYSEENANRAAKTLENAGFECSTIRCDLGNKEDILALVAFATSKGEVKYLVNAAGVSPSQAPVEEILRVDLYGTSVLLEEFGKVMADGGSGIIISSQSGHRLPALPQEQNDALAMSPVEELMRLPFIKEINDTLKAYQYSKRCNVLRVAYEACRWAKRGATINSISPGIIITPLANDELHGPRAKGYLDMIAGMPARRAGTPDEVGDLAEFLMSSRGRFISGADFLIDGGCTASYWYGDLQYLKATH